MTSMLTHVFKILLACLFLTILPCSTLSDNNTILNRISTNENNFNECISQIMKQNIPCNTFGSIINSETEISSLIESLNKYECYSVIIRNFNNLEWNIWYEFYIIIENGVAELISGLLELKKDILWNPGAKFIVTVKNCNDSLIQEVFQQFLKHKMYNILFLNHVNSDTLIHTYDTFRDDNCGDHIDKIEYIGSCSETNISKQFPVNDFSYSRNCRLKAVMFEEKPRYHSINNSKNIMPIVEQYVLDSFAYYSNFTIDYEVIKAEKDFGIVTPNGTATGLLRSIQHNLADIAVGSTVVIRNRATLFDFIYGFNFASFQLYTSALGTEMWKKVYKEFDVNTYIIILVFYCLIVVVCICFLKKSPEIPHSRIYLIIKMWGFFYLGNGTEPYSKTRRLRSVTICWIWFTFFISSFYNSDMYSLITGNVQRVRQIEPNKLSSLPYKPCIPKVIHTFFHYAYSEDLPESYDTVACHSIDGALDTTANGYDLYTVQMKPSYTDREVDFIDANGNRKLDSWNYGSDILLGFYVAKGLPYKNKLQMHAQKMYETGLVTYYKQIVNPPKGAVDRRKKNTSKPFVLGDFRVHFAVLFVGSVISTLTFLIEVFYCRNKVVVF